MLTYCVNYCDSKKVMLANRVIRANSGCATYMAKKS